MRRLRLLPPAAASLLLPLALLRRAGAAPEAVQVHDTFTIGGACDSKSFLNGLSFHLMGYTRGGSPWFQAIGSAQYLYYDPDCARSGDGTPRWILDGSVPDVSATSDLDNDRGCNYYARINSDDPSAPPMVGNWTMQCDTNSAGLGGWVQVYLLLLPQARPSTMPSTQSPGLDCNMCQPPTLLLSGACDARRDLNGLVFQIQGLTAERAPYYKASGSELYIYHDPACDGNPGAGTPARWIIDRLRPSVSRSSDLDADGQCDYDASVNSLLTGVPAPPAAATWRMYCGDGVGWQDVLIWLQPVGSTTTSTTQPLVRYVSGAPSLRRAPLLAATIGCLAPLL